MVDTTEIRFALTGRAPQVRVFAGPTPEAIGREMRRIAGYGFCFKSTDPREAAYQTRCSALDAATGTRLIFTRDQCHHTSGWWKNPDYERCWHLSLSFLDAETGEVAPKNEALTLRWLQAFFRPDEIRMLWAEPPYTAEARRAEVWHYRLFCNEGWEGIVPRGEVYSREHTERGWKSFSEIQAQNQEEPR